jgi:hypothetical protein
MQDDESSRSNDNSQNTVIKHTLFREVLIERTWTLVHVVPIRVEVPTCQRPVSYTSVGPLTGMRTLTERKPNG